MLKKFSNKEQAEEYCKFLKRNISNSYIIKSPAMRVRAEETITLRKNDDESSLSYMRWSHNLHTKI